MYRQYNHIFKNYYPESFQVEKIHTKIFFFCISIFRLDFNIKHVFVSYLYNEKYIFVQISRVG